MGADILVAPALVPDAEGDLLGQEFEKPVHLHAHLITEVVLIEVLPTEIPGKQDTPKTFQQLDHRLLGGKSHQVDMMKSPGIPAAFHQPLHDPGQLFAEEGNVPAFLSPEFRVVMVSHRLTRAGLGRLTHALFLVFDGYLGSNSYIHNITTHFSYRPVLIFFGKTDPGGLTNPVPIIRFRKIFKTLSGFVELNHL
jgi:hypothetical protein